MELNEKNYYSKIANLEYLSCSQLKDFLKCETYAMAKLNEEWQDKDSIALLQSSYIDEYFSGTLDNFKEEHPEMFKKDGELKAEFKILDNIIKQAEEDEMFKKYLQGDHQVIQTGKINNVPFKIKMDSYFKDKVIVDLKAIKNFDLIWDETERTRKNFIDYYNYILQAAIYQEIDFQNTNKRLDFIIAALTKEEISERALLKIPQEDIDNELNKIYDYLPRVQAIKQGKIKPTNCGHCEYCKSKAKVNKIFNYKNYFEKRGGKVI